MSMLLWPRIGRFSETAEQQNVSMTEVISAQLDIADGIRSLADRFTVRYQDANGFFQA